MQTSRLRSALLGLLGAVLILPSTLPAQAVTGVGDDATLPRKGEIRDSLLSGWTNWYERYGQGTPGRPNGSVEPLGVDFNFDSIGVAQFENLAPVQSSIRSLAGMPGFTASLGTTLVHLRDNVLASPLSAEFGVTRRISVSVLDSGKLSDRGLELLRRADRPGDGGELSCRAKEAGISFGQERERVTGPLRGAVVVADAIASRNQVTARETH
jgi:hypothetical protein